MPKDSGTARVEWKDFPLLPPSFLTVRHVKTDTGWNPDINALLQLKIIAKVLNACDTIIAATDASREGEMLFRHLYGFLGCKQPCLRLWISSLTDEAITEGMANLLPCDRFDNLFLAADSRNRADWLLGVNSSYAICKAVGFGNNSLGRVQTTRTGGDMQTVPGEGEFPASRQLAGIRQPLQGPTNHKTAPHGRFSGVPVRVRTVR